MNQLCCQNVIILTAIKTMIISNEIFSKRGLHILHLNINSILTKINEIQFITNESNASITGISESKLDQSILNSEVDIEDYDVIRMDCSRRGGRVSCYNRK